MDDAPHDPADIPAPASYHWTPKLQRDFLESFATTGSVKISATRVGMSPSAVYQLKHRPEGAAFRLGCAAALLIARARLVDELLDRAIWGHDEMTTVYREKDRSLTKRRRIDSRLGLAMLARLDKMVETRAKAGEEMLAQLIAGDWPGFLSLFDIEPGAQDAEGHSAALALWLAGRDNRANPLATLWRGTAIANEVAQFSATSEPEPEAEPTPEEEAAEMTVWPDGETGEWRTDFPPPEGFTGIEEGVFGDPDYQRTLEHRGGSADRGSARRLRRTPPHRRRSRPPRLLRHPPARQRSGAGMRRKGAEKCGVMTTVSGAKSGPVLPSSPRA